MADAQKAIGVAGMITLAVGSANAVLKHKRPPTTRFLIGVGVAYFVFSAMAEFESLDEIAKGLAIGVMTTVLLSGDAGGLLTYIDTGEFNTKKSDNAASATGRQAATVVRPVQNPRNAFRADVDPASAIPGLVRVNTVRSGNVAAAPGL